MKWYIEFPIFYLIITVLFYALTPYRHEDTGLGIFISVIFGFMLSAAAYAGYKSTIKPKNKK